MNNRRVAIIAGGRTPFVRAGRTFAGLSALDLSKHVVKGLLKRHEIDPGMIEAIAFGVALSDPGKPNLAREIVLETDLPSHIEAQTVSSYCITGLRTITIIADAIAGGRIDAGIAGGAEAMSRFEMDMFKEPSTGLTMGEHTELTIKAWGIGREEQDRFALGSHQKAVAARKRLTSEIFPLMGESHDTGPRDDTSMEALSALRTPFAEDGTLTAGNSSPVTDGAAAVLLMSEERARAEGRAPLAYIRAVQYGAHHPDEGLLMAPAITVPEILKQTGLKLQDMDLIEIHEAFAAQVLANAKAWEQGWKGAPTGPVAWDRVNVSGSSIAVGHPWSATGGRIVITLANEMTRRNARYGLISICAAGAMAGAFVLERD